LYKYLARYAQCTYFMFKIVQENRVAGKYDNAAGKITYIGRQL